MYPYAFANVAVASELPLPDLLRNRSPAHYSIRLVHGLTPHGRVDARHDWLDTVGSITLTEIRCGAVHYLIAPGLLRARVNGEQLVVDADVGADVSAVRHTLLNQILSRVLDRDGELMLHAALLADTGKAAILLLGETCYGKSTLAAALAQAGVRLLSDDGVRVDFSGAGIGAIPTYPSLCLRPDSHAALYGGAPPASRTDVRGAAVALGGANALPLGAIVVLNAPGADTDITLQRMPSGAATMALVQNSFALDPNDLQRARTRLGQAAQVAAAVSAYRLGYPRHYALLPRVIARLRALPL